MEFTGTVIGLALTGQAIAPTLAGGSPDPLVEVKIVLDEGNSGMLQCRVAKSVLGVLNLDDEVQVRVLTRPAVGLSLVQS